ALPGAEGAGDGPDQRGPRRQRERRALRRADARRGGLGGVATRPVRADLPEARPEPPAARDFDGRVPPAGASAGGALLVGWAVPTVGTNGGHSPPYPPVGDGISVIGSMSRRRTTSRRRLGTPGRRPGLASHRPPVSPNRLATGQTMPGPTSAASAGPP